MNVYIKQRNSLDIDDAISNNKDYFGNELLSTLKNTAKRSALIEMDEIYLLDTPFFDRYAFVGLFQVDLHNWEDNFAPLTQLGLYNAFRDRITSSSFFYENKLKEEIDNFSKENETFLIETYHDSNNVIIEAEDYEKN